MKKSYLVYFLMITVLFFGCKKDDDDAKKNNNGSGNETTSEYAVTMQNAILDEAIATLSATFTMDTAKLKLIEECGFSITDDQSFEYITFDHIVSYETSSGCQFSTVVDYLDKETTYYCKAYIRLAGNKYESDNVITFTTKENDTGGGDELVLKNGPAKNITENGATLTAQITGGEDDVNVQSCRFYYGDSPYNLDDYVVSNINTGKNFEAVLNKLDPSTTYYYQAVVKIEGKEIKSKDILDFTTKDEEEPEEDVEIINAFVSNIQETSAFVKAQVNNNIHVQFEDYYLAYGTDPYNLVEYADAKYTYSNNSITANISGLSKGTQYYCMFVIVRSNGAEYTSEVLDFTTKEGDTGNDAEVKVLQAQAIGSGNFKFTAKVLSGKENIIMKGFYWGVDKNHLIHMDYTTDAIASDGTYSLVAEASTLNSGQTHYLQAYVMTKDGTKILSNNTYTFNP